MFSILIILLSSNNNYSDDPMSSLKYGPCGEKIGYYKDVVAEEFSSDMAQKTSIRWLIKKEDGANTFAMRVITVGEDGHINLHYHPWEHEIFILEGEADIQIGSNKYHVSEGHFLYIPPNVEHEYWNSGKSILKFICLIPSNPTVKEKIKREC